jgi:hypothetical protein
MGGEILLKCTILVLLLEVPVHTVPVYGTVLYQVPGRLLTHTSTYSTLT